MSRPDIFSVTRRFDLATVLVAMLGYAILFTVMLLMDAEAWELGVGGSLFAVVAAGQAVAMRWNSPRLASVIAGTAFWFTFAAVAWVNYTDENPCVFVALFLAAAAIGPASGYLVGALVGGVFLISYYLRESAWFSRRQPDEKASRVESPWEDTPTQPPQ
jgi:hypothetical protein